MLDSKDLEQIAKLFDASTQRIKTEIFTYMEANFGRRLDMLAEGHQTLLDTLAPKDRVDALEEEVKFLKTVIRSLAQEIENLKSA